MKAKRKPLEVLTTDELGVSVASNLQLLRVDPPSERQAGIKVSSVDELVEKLRNDAKVI